MPSCLAAVSTGTCTGEGIAIPAQVHTTTVCSQPPCPPANTACAPLPLATKISSCHWPPTPLTHKDPASAVKTVKIEGQIPLVMGDVLIDHKSDTTNQVINMFPTPNSGCTTPKPAACNCSLLTTEDAFGQGHPRMVFASTFSVFVEGRPLATVGDQLGPPCFAAIGTGAATVMVGL